MKTLEQHIADLNQPRASGPVPRPVLMSLRAPGQNIRVALESIEHASALYCALRDESGLGASEWPEATLMARGTWGRTEPLGRISYNGRVWSPGPWSADATPIYDPRQGEAA